MWSGRRDDARNREEPVAAPQTECRTGLSFFVAWKFDEPLIFESVILEFRWRNSERSTAPNMGWKTTQLANAKADANGGKFRDLKRGQNNDSKN